MTPEAMKAERERLAEAVEALRADHTFAREVANLEQRIECLDRAIEEGGDCE